MTFDYAKSAATAKRLIAQFGQSVTLRQVSNSGTEYAPTQTTTDTAITAVDLNMRARDLNGTLVGETLRTLYVATGAGVAPGKGDKIQIGGAWHEIAEVRPLAPGGTVVMWEVDLAA